MLPELSLEVVVQEVAETIPQLPVIPPDPVLILQPKAQKPSRAAAKAASSGPAPDQAPPEDPTTARQDPLEDPPAVGGVQEAQPRRVSGAAEGGATSVQESQAELPQSPAQQEAAASGAQACTLSVVHELAEASCWCWLCLRALQNGARSLQCLLRA